VALPVFTTREFFHTRMLVRTDAGINSPSDLRGKRVGVPEFQQTAAIWARGALQHEFGVKTTEIEWFMERPAEKSHGGSTGTVAPPGVTIHQIPTSTNIGEMLVAGELDAALLYLTNPNLVDRSRLDLSAHPRVRPMFPDREAEGRRYYAKTGLYPINHTVVVRRSLLEQHPWIALNLYSAFAKAKNEVAQRGQTYLRNYFTTGLLGDDVKRALAIDPMAYGVRSARTVLETIAQFVHEQGLTQRRVELEEIFAPSTMDL
jgi:4,5-dihydroxyphthalate decarboxylase